MSIEALHWVLTRSTANGNDRLVLLGIANHAHPDGSNSYPAVDSLAHYANVDRRTAQRRTRELEAAGFIEREGVGPEGQVRWRIAMDDAHSRPPRDVPRSGGRQPATGAAAGAGGGGKDAARTVKATVKGGEACARDPRDRPPPDFPDELRPHARVVMRVLREVARDHGARQVRALAVGRLLAANRRKPLVATALELHVWAADPPRPIRDVVSTYRTFLGKAPTLEAVEHVGDDGIPASRGRAGGENVHPLHQPRTASDRRAARQADRMRRAAGAADPSATLPPVPDSRRLGE